MLIISFQGHAQMGGDVATIPTAGKNFPTQRGLAIGTTSLQPSPELRVLTVNAGLCKSMVGLSGALATQFYQGFFAPNIVPFMLFLTVEVYRTLTIEH